MADAHGILSELVPVILLLTLGVIAAVASRAVGLSPIVGYIVLGLALSGIGLDLVADSTMIATLAELGVVFLLFDIGLHFSLGHIREQARDIFGFGPVQVLAGTLALGLFGLLFGLPVAAFWSARRWRFPRPRWSPGSSPSDISRTVRSGSRRPPS